jgi:hypothetical protein
MRDAVMTARAPVAPLLSLLLCLSALAPRDVRAQAVTLTGQASAWLTSKPDTAVISQTGLRYIPEVVVRHPLGGDWGATLDLSANGYATGDYGQGRGAQFDGTVKPYRAWLRVATHTLETRVGLQKINFGSATLFRPLMWFDRVDPRDPLQLTDGVWGALARYYFLNNTNVWGWALYGNTGPKGWEAVPTEPRSVEYGGRLQTPVPAGEVGAAFDRRSAELRALPGGTFVPEDRWGLDGKWNLGVGLWGEAALVHQRTTLAIPHYQRFWTLGADYTLGVGNGLYVLAEYARIEAPASPLGGGPFSGFSGLLLNYPVGLVDRISAIVYRGWQQHQWFRILTWQRTYDAWTLYMLGFWNPSQVQAVLPQQQSQSFAGSGLELMVTFNH